MELRELKDIMADGAKVVVVENDKPQWVVLSFDEYKQMKRQRLSSSPVVKREPSSFAREASPPRPEPAPSAREQTGLTLDDLPL